MKDVYKTGPQNGASLHSSSELPFSLIKIITGITTAVFLANLPYVDQVFGASEKLPSALLYL